MKIFYSILLICICSYAQIGSQLQLGTTDYLLNKLEQANLRATSPYDFQLSNGDNIATIIEDFYYEDGILSMSGNVPTSKGSMVMLKGDKKELYGWVILRDQNRAYEYTTDKRGMVTVEEVMISKVFSIDDFPLPPDTEYKHPEQKRSKLHNFSIPPAPHIGPYPGTNVNKLQSYPSAKKVLYCDITRIVIGDKPKHYTKEGLWELFQCVAGAFSAYQLNVTTDPDVYKKAGVPNSGILRFLDEDGRSFSPVKVFGTTRYSTIFRAMKKGDDPVALSTGRTAWHEAGHLMGVLDYGGKPGGTYFVGFPKFKWVPVMGNFWKANPWKDDGLQQWSKGEYETATVTSDVLKIISKISPYRKDDIPDKKPLEFSETTKIKPESNYGQICPNTDSDAFTFEIKGTSGHAKLKIERIEESLGGSMLDIDASIIDASGKVMVQHNPIAVRSAEIDIDLPKGNYSLIIKGGAEGTPKKGFSTYGSLGFYAISGEIIGGTTAIASGKKLKNTFYLNPIVTKGKIKLNIPNKYFIENISIFSSNGKQAFTTQKNIRTMDISRAAPGLYIIKIAVDGNQLLTKIVKN